MPAEALLFEKLLDGNFAVPGSAGQGHLDQVASAYAEALRNVTAKAVEIDSVVTQLELLSRFYDALSIPDGKNGAGQLVADRLLSLVRLLHPARPARADRPPHARQGASGGQAAT